MSVSIEFIEQLPLLNPQLSSTSQKGKEGGKERIRSSENRNNVDDHVYLGNNDVDKEDSPLFPAQNLPRRHQFDVEEYSSFFPEDSVLKEVFSKENSMLRFKLYVMWGLLSLSTGYFILKYSFDFTSGRSFFVVAATLSTVGYGPSFDTIILHKFLSYFSLVHVFPFVFLQVLVASDSTIYFAEYFKEKIKLRCAVGDFSPPHCFRAELRLTISKCFVMLSIILVLGSLLFWYCTDAVTWTDSIFFAVTSSISIGNGSFAIDSGSYGYIGIGCYSIFCNCTMTGLLLPTVTSFWIIAVENQTQNSRIQKIRRQSMIKNQIRIETSYDDRNNFIIDKNVYKKKKFENKEKVKKPVKVVVQSEKVFDTNTTIEP